MISQLLQVMKQWLRPSRLVPLLTILGAGTALILNLLNVLQLAIPEQIIIALLTLLAVDSLTERLAILEKIEMHLKGLPEKQTLKKRNEMSPVYERIKDASSIDILVVSGTSIILPYIGHYKERLKNNCHIRIILLDPDSPSLQNWGWLIGRENIEKAAIEMVLENLKNLTSLPGVKGTCKIRFTQVLLPFSLFSVNTNLNSGTMNVEYHAYKVAIDERPHLSLSVNDDPYWFNYYKQQFEKAWDSSKIWKV